MPAGLHVAGRRGDRDKRNQSSDSNPATLRHHVGETPELFRVDVAAGPETISGAMPLF
jgi:hypothetical protein